MEIYFCRKLVGQIDPSGLSTLGDLLIKTVDLINQTNPNLNGPSGTDLINSPPPHSNWSFMLLRGKGRYISCLSLAQVNQKKNIGLNSAVYRKIDQKDVPDISYKSSNMLYVFDKLPDWHKLLQFDQSQSEILKAHHQFINTKDAAFRTKNQKLRLELASQLGKFLANQHVDQQISAVTKAPSQVNKHISSPQPKSSPPPPKADQPRSGGALPGFINSSPKVKKQVKSSQVQSNILSVLTDPTGIMSPSDQTESTELSADEEYEMLEKEIKSIDQEITQVENDYQLAQALHIQLNNAAPELSEEGRLAIQRLAGKGIAVNALSGV